MNNYLELNSIYIKEYIKSFAEFYDTGLSSVKSLFPGPEDIIFQTVVNKGGKIRQYIRRKLQKKS